jgi:hypothetical protein
LTARGLGALVCWGFGATARRRTRARGTIVFGFGLIDGGGASVALVVGPIVTGGTASFLWFLCRGGNGSTFIRSFGFGWWRLHLHILCPVRSAWSALD